MKFKKNDEFVDAVQWDGTYEHAKEIEQELKVPTIVIKYNEVTGLATEWVMEVKENGSIVGGVTAFPKDWIVTPVYKNVVPMFPEDFYDKYEIA